YRTDPMAPSVLAYRVWRFALVGRWAAADSAFVELDRTMTGSSRQPDLAVANLALGNREAALAALESAARSRSYNLVSAALGCDPVYSPLKSEPRFIAVMKQFGQGMCTESVRWPIPARPAGR
ncbi:MAG TPA: hypothetical protein VFC35_10715, partial [Gemmatimonadaceae bacterium]|nr:hypothetical protein [Gemmatimonadaceae bacterium]